VETSDFAEAQGWASELFGTPNIFHIWFPSTGFVKASRSASSLAFTRSDKELYGLGLGDSVRIDSDWHTFSIPRSLPKEMTAGFVLAGQWDAYAINTQAVSDPNAGAKGYEHLMDNEEIQNFLDIHAPESSTKPGNPEILFWGGLREESGQLLAVAALTRWESGGHVLSSVGVHQDRRGKGLAQLITQSIVYESAQRGISTLALGVAGKNEPAKAAYEKVGFACMGKFNYFERA